MTIEALKQALEALEGFIPYLPLGDEAQCGRYNRAITALSIAIEQAEKQEPVAWMFVNTDGECEQIEYIKNEPMPDDPSVTPLYTAPRQWQGLTDDEIMEPWPFENRVAFARWLEAKLKEKNT